MIPDSVAVVAGAIALLAVVVNGGRFLRALRRNRQVGVDLR